MELDKKNELNQKGKIKVLVGDNEKNLNIISKHLISYQQFLKKSKNINFLGLDFEFNPKTHDTKKAALAQLYLEGYPNKDNELGLIFDPTDKLIEEEFRKTLLSQNLKIILHGGESLDIPFIFYHVLKNKKDIVQFTSNLIDTKYLCEYDLIMNPIEGHRCKIYYLLLQKKVITQKKFNDLIKNEENMGKIYTINIDVKNLSPNLLKYAIYDVIFLPQLVRNLDYTNLIDLNTLVQLNLLWKNNLIPKINSQKENIDKILNSYNSSNIRMNEIFNLIITHLDNNQYKQINYVKKFIEQIQKIYFLPILLKLDDFYYSTNVKVNDTLKPIDLPPEIKNIFDKQLEILKKIIRH